MDVEKKELIHADQDLERNVRLYLTHLGHRPVRDLEVEARDGVVTLRGEVPSYHIRQLAIACVCRVAGVRKVVDQIITLSSCGSTDRNQQWISDVP